MADAALLLVFLRPSVFLLAITRSRAAVYDLSALQAEIEKLYNITTTQFAAVLTSFYVANIATCMLASWLSKLYGRK